MKGTEKMTLQSSQKAGIVCVPNSQEVGGGGKTILIPWASGRNFRRVYCLSSVEKSALTLNAAVGPPNKKEKQDSKISNHFQVI